MDIHQDLDSQTRCDSFDSIDISQYLYKLIKNTTEPLDFFLEIQYENLFFIFYFVIINKLNHFYHQYDHILQRVVHYTDIV